MRMLFFREEEPYCVKADLGLIERLGIAQSFFMLCISCKMTYNTERKY